VKCLDSAGGLQLINGPLRDTIIKHEKAERFGIRLIHAPFDVEDPEDDTPSKKLGNKQYVVNFGNVAFPVPVKRMSPQERAKIVPTTWVFGSPNVATPVEYSLTPDPIGDMLSTSDLALFEDISKILIASPAINVLGLSMVHPSLPGIRFKRGNSIITLPMDLNGFVPGEERFDTIWVFHPDHEGAIVQCAESGGRVGVGKFDENF
jgi:hypothetical protein